ncbi:MAG: hypothetical protein CMN34_07795 [Saprospirales bacterium]|nr:hypothetical protein [Saprospirales bacterium]
MDFIEPKRQHPLGVLILSVQFLWKLGQQAWPMLIGLSFSIGDNFWQNAVIASIASLALTGAYALLYYWRFKYSVEERVLIVEKGILHRERLQVPFERIQTIQLFQGPIQQLFGLTGLRVDTAGSSGSEIKLVAISRAAGEALQDILRNHTSDSNEHGEEHGAIENDDDLAAPTETAGQERSQLVSLSISQLFKVGLSQNHLRNAFASLALISYLIGNQPDALTSWLDGMPAFMATLIGAAMLLLILPGMVLFLMSGVAVSVATAFLRYYDLRSSIGADGLHAEMGLLRRNTFQMPYARIHLTIWRSNWIRRKLGFETLEIRQAQAESGGQGGVRVSLPALEPCHRAVLENVLYPDITDNPVMEVLPVRRLRWLLMVFSALPAGLFWLVFNPLIAAVVSGAWLTFAFWTTAKRYASFRMTVYTDTIVLEKGWFWRQRILLRLAQIQGVEWERHVFLERRSIGHIVFHTAAGARRFTYVLKRQGEMLRDFALNQHHARNSRA